MMAHSGFPRAQTALLREPEGGRRDQAGQLPVGQIEQHSQEKGLHEW